MWVREMSDKGEPKILVVEDEYWLAEDIRRALAEAGCAVVGPFATVAEAMASLDNTPVGGAILDINLRGQEVFPLASELRRRQIPYAFTTGYGEESLPAEHRDVPRWQKPFEPDEMVSSFLARTAATPKSDDLVS
jgi:DNA-binding response OmpR family regulator